MLFDRDQRLGGRNEIDQDLAGVDRAADQQVPQVSEVGPLIIIAEAKLPKILSHSAHDAVAVLMDQIAAVHIDHVIKAALFMKTQGQRAVLYSIPEAVFHLVAVRKKQGAFDRPLITVGVLSAGCIQKSSYALLLTQKLIGIGNSFGESMLPRTICCGSRTRIAPRLCRSRNPIQHSQIASLTDVSAGFFAHVVWTV